MGPKLSSTSVQQNTDKVKDRDRIYVHQQRKLCNNCTWTVFPWELLIFKMHNVEFDLKNKLVSISPIYYLSVAPFTNIV